MRVCMYCVAEKGLKGSDLKEGSDVDLDDDEKFYRHIESEHHIPIRRLTETNEQAMERFKKLYPEAGGPKCKCPQCKMLRNLGRK